MEKEKEVEKKVEKNESYWNEKWAPIVFKGEEEASKYEVSNYGRIRSFTTSKKGKILRGSILDGYKVLNVRLPDNKNITNYVHKLVGEAFLEKTNDNQIYVIHKDYNKLNNYFENLQWATQVDLTEHKKSSPNRVTGRINNNKLTETKVKLIKRILARNKKTRLKMIAKQFGITHTQLNRIRRGENWGHVQPD